MKKGFIIIEFLAITGLFASGIFVAEKVSNKNETKTEITQKTTTNKLG